MWFLCPMQRATYLTRGLLNALIANTRHCSWCFQYVISIDSWPRWKRHWEEKSVSACTLGVSDIRISHYNFYPKVPLSEVLKWRNSTVLVLWTVCTLCYFCLCVLECWCSFVCLFLWSRLPVVFIMKEEQKSSIIGIDIRLYCVSEEAFEITDSNLAFPFWLNMKAPLAQCGTAPSIGLLWCFNDHLHLSFA